MNEQESTQQKPNYSIRVTYVPYSAIVQTVTIWNEGLGGSELGELIEHVETDYKPAKIIIVRKEEKGD